ncbi:class I SAM-dependent methyltransferase [Shimia abyssi]|uniref:Ubiquinone/menaquinone biosynthesis C-methylase UbiE n=1 Tax=Shimia abyssi TaxID=1662395 RepID=A0A2P8FBH0_9RHOB|nr:class I SAM-dependent methyltransferase [Shimia abyssi]PSL19077.1 ubiquinone/menaquinone biosynthesis C-methylase UbiE [Shimia abyssi]
MKTDHTFWDKLAAKYALSPIRDTESYEYTLERTRSYLKETDQILELGCGTAATAIRLAGSAAQVVASDFSSGMLEQGRLRLGEAGVVNVELVQAAPETAPEGPFDMVLALNLLHLIDDLDAALGAVADRTKDGGLFVSKTPCLGEGIKSFKFRLMKVAIPLMQFFGNAPFVRFLSVRDLEAALVRAGFQIIETGNYPVDPVSRYVVARKV